MVLLNQGDGRGGGCWTGRTRHCMKIYSKKASKKLKEELK